MEIVWKGIGDLIPYENNPRHNEASVDRVANSIREFGFKVPIVIDKDGTIVCGHTRYKASMKLGLEEVPCIIADDLSDEQIRAFRLADNKVGEASKWDFELLDFEMEQLPNMNMEQFGFEFEEPEPKKNERLRTDERYKLPQIALWDTEGYYQMPKIRPIDYTPKRLIGFNYAMSSMDYGAGIHFYIDDYQFERIWNDTDRYVEILKRFDCVLTPDFSLYMDMPMAMKIWNTFRSRLIGQICQQAGMIVIPTISWAEEETLDWCFDGIPEDSTASISTVGVRRSKEATEIWKMGTDALIKKKHPRKILLYGGGIDYDFNGIEIVEYENEVTERMKA